ncbi:GntR family transcriptional regulator [Lacrimispora celerecrescens]|uniref:HTH gntR-type domain-containing protein n=1 Tax=Lacrimispora celerecrescens TaxID=29354 RepID=A0A084JMU9_9FIRM|nr:GntR family transcriptional regulator [Lacrimispora celerecrescens]KEZ90283.1 hypothetical protein IO98_10025 [Lacrimispora celerecrescens]
MEKDNMGPKYKQIKEDIVESILGGVYEPGDMIPKQSDYAAQYNVSRLTVRKAIDDLVIKGILRTEKGKGTFVQEIATKAYSYRRLDGFSSNVVSKTAKVHSKVVAIEETAADKSLAFYLQIAENDKVIMIGRLRYVNEVCVAFQKSYLSKARVADIDFEKENLNEYSLYNVLQQKAGLIMSYVDERFRAIRADKELSSYFQVEEGEPILYVKRVAYDSQNVPIEYCKDYESSDVNGIWVRSISIE